MESKGSLLCSQEPATGPYLEPDALPLTWDCIIFWTQHWYSTTNILLICSGQTWYKQSGTI